MTVGSSRSGQEHFGVDTPKPGTWRRLAPNQTGGARGLFLSLALAAAIPILSFGGWVAYLTANEGRELARRAAEETVARVTALLEAQLVQEANVAQTLARSTALDAEDISRFAQEVRQTAAARPLWQNIVLTDRQGHTLLSAGSSDFGTVVETISLGRALLTFRPTIGGLGPAGRTSVRRLVPLRVPVMRDDQLKFVLTVGLAPDQIGTILRQVGFPLGWTGAIIDDPGNVVADTSPAAMAAGAAATPEMRRALQHAPSGFYRALDQSGITLETAYRTLATIEGWSVHLTIPSAQLDRPVQRSMVLLIIGAVVSTGLAVVLVLMVARDVARRRREEALKLDASERRGALSIEAAELGTWRWDLSLGEIAGSDRFRRMLDLPSSATPAAAVWPAETVLSQLHQDDRFRLKEAASECVSRSSPLAIEFRAVRMGKSHWFRAIGRAEAQSHPHGSIVYGVLADIHDQKVAEQERAEWLRRIAVAHEDEQRKLARELHDQVGQTVTGLALGLKGLERNLRSPDLPEAEEKVRWLQGLVQDIARDIHRVAAGLRSAALEDAGFFAAARLFLRQWSTRYGIAAVFNVEGPEQRPPAHIELVLYRIIQEALSNVLKHARATTVSVNVAVTREDVRLDIEDNGVGLEGATRNDEGFGIVGIRERLAVVGGSLGLHSISEAGTALAVRIPLSDEGEPR